MGHELLAIIAGVGTAVLAFFSVALVLFLVFASYCMLRDALDGPNWFLK